MGNFVGRFQRAEEFPGHVTLTPPYLDTLGAGYIATISHTIYEGKWVHKECYYDKNSWLPKLKRFCIKFISVLGFLLIYFCWLLYRPASLHSPHDRVVAVMGMDLTMGFLHKLLSEVIPICAHQNIR